jgi:hypothetical protein
MPWQHGERDLHHSSKHNLQRIVIFLSLRWLLTAQKAENRFQAQSNKKKVNTAPGRNSSTVFKKPYFVAANMIVLRPGIFKNKLYLQV